MRVMVLVRASAASEGGDTDPVWTRAMLAAMGRYNAALRDAGVAVLVVSVELDEVLALSDLILVMCGGRLTGTRRPPPDAAGDPAFVGEIGLMMAGVEAGGA